MRIVIDAIEFTTLLLELKSYPICRDGDGSIKINSLTLLRVLAYGKNQ